jgi:hypothetical protein
MLVIPGKNREVLVLSLRILSQVIAGAKIPQADVIKLRRSADPAEADLPIDELCCSLIQRELNRN